MEMPSTLRDEPEVEYLDGRPYPKVSPKRTHALVQRAFLRVLERQGPEHGEFGPEWRFDVGAADRTDTELVPDIAFISFERLDAFSEAEAEEPPCSPDLAIEIRSPSSRPAYIRTKIDRYLKTGASLVLDVDPTSAMIYAHGKDGIRCYGKGDRFAHPALPWFVFEVAEVFPKPRTPKR